eukprot:TRINITY_DN4078_c0_g1_i1.p1 TRINITY_DN4078_c0_g1~~TRINITY_DN4078_c0_g1_i1.p1  ORF type:complete len:209 (-),score=43.42 TRINITY_DN4078_c0_g1_i1:94-675(-)
MLGRIANNIQRLSIRRNTTNSLFFRRSSPYLAYSYATKTGLTIDETLPLKTTENKNVTAKDFFSGKKVVLVGLPGAFTPVCTADHIPGYVRKFDEFKQKGVDSIACVTVNDPFVTKAWAQHLGAAGKIDFIPDWDGKLTKALDQTIDLSKNGLGHRTMRFAAVVDNGKVTKVFTENDPQELKISAADSVIKQL